MIEATVSPSIQPLALRRQQLGEDPVLRRGVGRRAEPHHRVGGEHQRVSGNAGEFDVIGEEHHHAAGDLDRVGDEHHPALRDRVGKGPDECRERHVGHGEEEFQQRNHPRRAVELEQLGDRGDQQGVVGEGAEKLRRHDRVETPLHDFRRLR